MFSILISFMVFRGFLNFTDELSCIELRLLIIDSFLIFLFVFHLDIHSASYYCADSYTIPPDVHFDVYSLDTSYRDFVRK